MTFIRPKHVVELMKNHAPRPIDLYNLNTDSYFEERVQNSIQTTVSFQFTHAHLPRRVILHKIHGTGVK